MVILVGAELEKTRGCKARSIWKKKTNFMEERT